MRLTTVSVAEQVAFHLAKQIIEGQLQPKEHVQESRLVKEYQVSRSSVREALLIVARWHLIEIYPNRGAIVRAVNIQDVQSFFEVWWVLFEKLLLDLNQNAKKETEALLKTLSSTYSKNLKIQSISDLPNRSEPENLSVFCQRLMDKLKKLCVLSYNPYLQTMLLELLPVMHHYLYFLLNSKRIPVAKVQQFVCILDKEFRGQRVGLIRLLVGRCIGLNND